MAESRDDTPAMERLEQELERLRQENARLRKVRLAADMALEHAPVAVQIFDAAGQTVLVNEAQRRFLGLPDAASAYGFNVLTDPFSVANGSAALFARAYAGEVVEVPSFEVDLEAARSHWPTSARRAIFEQLIYPVRGGDGRVVAAVSFLREITDRRRTEAALVEAQRHESLGLLASGIAHDFNNLLVGILGHASVAQGRLPPDSAARASLQRIEVAASRAADLTRQMLAYAGRARSQVAVVDLSREVDEMVDLLRVSLGRSVALQLDLAPDLPGVRADLAQLRQVLMNLITNASDAIGEDRGIVTVSTRAVEVDAIYLAGAGLDERLQPGMYAAVEVSDTGVGMDAETQRRIFDPFFTTKPEGHGLGLAAVLGIVQAHGGAIRAYSEPGHGTTFKVLLPAVEAAATEAPEALAAPPAAGDAGRGRPARVLVVDDEPAVRELAEAVLEDAGYDVLLADSGEAAVALFLERADDVDAVLLDLTMPGMDGAATYDALRSVREGVRVVLSSGYDGREALARFQAARLAGFLQKPYRANALLEAVSAALGAVSPPTRRGADG